MPDIATHFGLSLLVNMAIFGRKDKKKWLWIIFLSPLSIYHDLDIFFNHRVILHSFIIQSALVLGVYLITRRNLFFTVVVGVNVFGHVLMDMSQFYVACFWPITDGVFAFHLDIFVNMDDPSNIDTNITGDYEGDFPKEGLEQWGTVISTLGLVTTLTAGVVWLVNYLVLKNMDVPSITSGENFKEKEDNK